MSKAQDDKAKVEAKCRDLEVRLQELKAENEEVKSRYTGLTSKLEVSAKDNKALLQKVNVISELSMY